MLILENHLHMEAIVFLDINILGQIQNYIRVLLQSEEFHSFYMLAQKYYLLPGILQLNNNLISQDMVEYIIALNI